MNRAFEIQLAALRQDMLREQIFLLAITVILIGVMCWVSYLVIRAAIRDGIKESGLLEAIRAPRRTISQSSSDLPDMRAD